MSMIPKGNSKSGLPMQRSVPILALLALCWSPGFVGREWRIWPAARPAPAAPAGLRARSARPAVQFQRAGSHSGPDAQRLLSQQSKPLLVFLPGIDGAARLRSVQFRRLWTFYDSWAMDVTADDRSDLDELLNMLETFIKEHRADRPVLLVAESMGAVLALNLAFNQPKLNEALCLINPATSYRRTPLSLLAPLLPSLPENLYETLPAVITPLVGRVGWYEGVISSQQVDSAGSSPLENFLRISRGLSKALPPETLRFRESLLRKGLRRLEPRMADPPAIVTLLVAGDADAVLPSVAETARLQKLLPGAQRVVLPGVAHACFDDVNNVNLLSLLTDAGITQRLTQAKVSTPSLTPKTWLDRSLLQARSWVSPVFLSTAHGRVMPGLPVVDAETPLLLVGNHQLFSLDGIFIVEEFLREQQRLVTAMVYPPLLDEVSPLDPLPYPFPGSLELFEKFQVKPTSPRNLLKTLRPGNAALLFPGGAREVFKRKGEEYQLFWPDAPDLVRIAAKANATIVPFSGVGSDEFFAGTVLDSDELLGLPVIGDWFRERIQNLPTFVEDDVFVPPVPVPRIQGPRRNYFLFGEPVPTAEVDHKDRAACAEIYSQIRSAVKVGMDYLLSAREDDPFEDMPGRYAWEQATGVQAPSFDLRKWGRVAQASEASNGGP
ncbi:unnamed protein product [Durusdinium trenchii]|uniref:AB hydrolase-1 domain-containing protein n=1 Tax=Durusdinium trenchii TaxID=1381693 RepID=A0ABP0N371_9DINO